MKRRIFLFLICLLLFPIGVDAKNKIYSIDMDITVDKNGNASIVEVWDVDGDDGTEWYKVMNNLGNSKLTNFKVSMDGRPLTYKFWYVSESLSQKKGYYGINYTSSGLELCFGKYDYNRHRFTLSYDLSNIIINTEDSQVFYWTLIDRLDNVDFDNFSVTVSSYYEFPDTLDVWGYGYEGYAYVKNGKMEMSNKDNNMKNDYVTLLAKFPLNTFNTLNTDSKYDTFNDVLNKAEKGTFSADLVNNAVNFFIELCQIILVSFPFVVLFIGIFYVNKSSKYGYVNNKKIVKKDVPMFREIPCNKDIYYANALIKLNSFDYSRSNILGAIILKWVRADKIGFKNETKGLFNKETSVIDLTMNPEFDNELEKNLFDVMYKASKDGMLEAKELERWSRNNYTKFFDLFSDIENDMLDKLRDSGHIYKRTNKKECKFKNVMDDTIYNDSIQLYGLKKYLEEFSRIDTKEVMEVKLWDEYLMFAYLFGIADKVAKQLKDMYPEVSLQMEQSNFDYDTLIFINNMSVRSVSAASSARSAAQSYSGGGGGFSSSGGGGGSFGGGGGGSR